MFCLYTVAARRHYLWAIPGRDVNRTMQLSVTRAIPEVADMLATGVNPYRCDSWTQKSLCVLCFFL